MENEEKNLNTELNDIAGNRVDGPVGNTAAKPGRPGTGVGMPGGPPATEQPASSPTALASSEALAASEMSAGGGALAEGAAEQENRAADPAKLVPTRAYGGNFGNSTQSSHNDQARRDNQDSDANRGEFGAQDLGGTTHGGFGNQNRRADYEPHGTPEDAYYGGPGAPGPQENAYRAYDGRDDRPDSRTEYGFERGTAPAPEADRTGDTASAHRNDNGAPKGPDPGYATDYGHTSLRPETDAQESAPANPGRRNQSTDDYLPVQARHDSEGHHAEAHPINSAGHSASDESRRAANARGGDRSGYVQAPDGDSDQGMGSRGGSYNDAYDDSKPGSNAGSPTPGDQRREDIAQNFGAEAREENRATDEENRADHGAPQRNAGRD